MLIKTKEDFYRRKEQLIKKIEEGKQARAELENLEHRYGWAVFTNKGCRSGLDELPEEGVVDGQG